MYQNCGVHAENTERDSPPFQEYVGISRDIIYVYTCICILFPHSFVLYVCMYAYVSVWLCTCSHVHMCTYYNAFQIGMRKLCPWHVW